MAAVNINDVASQLNTASRLVMSTDFFWIYMAEPTLKSKACLKCLYFTKIISALCCYLEYFSYLYTIN